MNDSSRHVLVLMPTLRDGERTAQLLQEAGVPCTVCQELVELARHVRRGAEAVILTDDALFGDTAGHLADALRSQPAWSAVPVIVMAREGTSEALQRATSEAFSSLTVVERPVRTRTLISVVLAALRGRRHQYQIRDAIVLAEGQAAEIRAQEERLRYALAAGGLGSWDLPLDDAETLSDALGRAGFGRPGSAALGTPDAVLQVHPDDRARVVAALHESVTRGAEYDVEHRVVSADGTVRCLLVRGHPVVDGHGRRMVGVSLDITDRKGMQDALAQQAEELRDADRRKDEFLATLAHELRNPLAPIRTGVELLASDPSVTTAEKAIGVMGRQLNHMVRLVDDLLDVSRITSAKLELKRTAVTLGAVVDAAVEASRPAIDHAGHRLTVEVTRRDALLDADLTRLAQVVSNLLHNASKYTPDGGNIALQAHVEGFEATIAVRDDGIGIAPESIGSVFEMFSQIKSAYDPTRGGLGIGLALVRSLVTMHGGTVVATSAGAGAGTTFTVRLPLMAPLADASRPASTRQPPDDAAPPHRRRVLVVDDNVDAADLLSMLLERAGYEPRVVYDGASAIDAVAEAAPDLVVLDIGLPDMSGYDVARALRRTDRGRRLGLVALTGWGTNDDKKKALDAGFDVHLTKPIDAALLRKVLAELSVVPAAH